MKIEFQISKKIAKKARRLISELCVSKTPLGKFYQFSVAISIFFITLSLLQLIPSTIKVYKAFPFYVIYLAVFICSIVFYYSVRWYLKTKIIEKTGLLNSKITYIIQPDKIVHYTDNGLKLEITGNDIKQFTDYKDYLLMFVRDNYAYYIPPNSFPDSNQREEAKSLIQSIINNCTANNAPNKDAQ